MPDGLAFRHFYIYVHGHWHGNAALMWTCNMDMNMQYTVHCNPSEAYMLLVTASCEAGPGSTHMCTFETFIWRILILEFADRCYFQFSTFDLSKLHLYFKIVNFLKLSYQGSNFHPMRISEFALNLKVSPARIEPTCRIFWLGSCSLQ